MNVNETELIDATPDPVVPAGEGEARDHAVAPLRWACSCGATFSGASELRAHLEGDTA